MTQIQDPRTAPALKWGVLGPGGIARTVCTAMQAASSQVIYAVGSRSVERAHSFAAEFGAERAYGSYEELVADADVDIVYIATPHSEHAANALLAIAAGKPVVIEKPLTINAAQAEAVVSAAREAGVFVMEAMWTRFLPHLIEVRSRLAAGYIGQVIAYGGDFCGHSPDDPAGRWLNPELGGGALLDMGVYPLSIAIDLLGFPTEVTARATLAATGVDATLTALMEFADGVQGVMTTSVVGASPWRAWVAGSEGTISIEPPLFAPSAVHFKKTGQDEEIWTYPMAGRGYEYQMAEAARCVAVGQTASAIMTPEDSVRIMALTDQMRAQIGLVYPGE